MSQLLGRFGLIAALIGMVSCGSAPVAPDRIASIRSISVGPVTKAEAAAYNGPEAAWGTALGGIVGALIAHGAVTAPEQIKAYLAEQEIDPAEIARTEFLNGLKADPRFGGKLTESGDAHFELFIYLYGLTQDGSFSLEYKTFFGIKAKLVDSSGAVIWEDKDFLTRYSKLLPAAPYKAYFEDPSHFKDGFTGASAEITQLLLKKL